MNSKGINSTILVAGALIFAVFIGSWVITSTKEVGVGFALAIAFASTCFHDFKY